VTSHAYPFSAIVGQPDLKLALLLASVDWRLSVLLKGDKGSGKSTAARALADILPSGAEFVNLPIGTTEDRLLGGLDLAQALQGEARLKRGLIHDADGGVLYIDEVNLLSDSLSDALLDVASSGRHYVERDGFSASADARFVLLGSMNVEEGALRPQLLDRFALSLDVNAPLSVEDRAQIVEFRMRFDEAPALFCRNFEEEQRNLQNTILQARAHHIQPASEMLIAISQAITEAGVRSLRADLAALRAAVAHAALAGRAEVTQHDVDSVLPLVLNHRVKQSSTRKQENPQTPAQTGQEGGPAKGRDRVFPVEHRHAPEVRLKAEADPPSLRGRTLATDGEETLDLTPSFTRSFRNTGAATLQADQLVFRKPKVTAGTRFIFVVDSSGSHAAQQRMRAVKGAIAALLESSVDTKDEVAVISFRGSKAEIVLEPCRDVETAKRVLEFLPTGGRTPLAHALDLAGSLTDGSSLVVLVTDGRANVSLAGGDPWEEALNAASRLNCSAIVVDSSLNDSGSSAALASALKGALIRLDDLSHESLLTVRRA
jgi:magnesium chelatase subunit D